MDAEFQLRLNMMIADEMSQAHYVNEWFYLSYADDDGFRGGCYVQAFGPVTAALRASIEGISPGGQVRIVNIPKEHEDNLPPPDMRNRLLSLEELKEVHPMVTFTGEDA